MTENQLLHITEDPTTLGSLLLQSLSLFLSSAAGPLQFKHLFRSNDRMISGSGKWEIWKDDINPGRESPKDLALWMFMWS